MKLVRFVENHAVGNEGGWLETAGNQLCVSSDLCAVALCEGVSGW